MSNAVKITVPVFFVFNAIINFAFVGSYSRLLGLGWLRMLYLVYIIAHFYKDI